MRLTPPIRGQREHSNTPGGRLGECDTNPRMQCGHLDEEEEEEVEEDDGVVELRLLLPKQLKQNPFLHINRSAVRSHRP